MSVHRVRSGKGSYGELSVIELAFGTVAHPSDWHIGFAQAGLVVTSSELD